MTIGIALSSALFLSSCTTFEETNTPVTVTQTVEADPTTPTNDEQPTTYPEESLQETTGPNSSDQQTDNDQAFAAIDTILSDHPGGIIVYIDRWDERRTSNPGYDIDVVVDSHVLKREVEFSSEETRASSVGHASKAQNHALIADQQGMPHNNVSVSDTSDLFFANAQYSAQGDSELGTMDGREVIPRWQGEYGSSPMDNPNQVTPIPREESKGYKEHNPSAELDDDAATIVTAMKASVTASEAIEQALNQYPDGVLEQAQLERDNHGVNWVIQLSKDNQQPLVELQIPAS